MALLLCKYFTHHISFNSITKWLLFFHSISKKNWNLSLYNCPEIKTKHYDSRNNLSSQALCTELPCLCAYNTCGRETSLFISLELYQKLTYMDTFQNFFFIIASMIFWLCWFWASTDLHAFLIWRDVLCLIFFLERDAAGRYAYGRKAQSKWNVTNPAKCYFQRI